MSALSPLTRDRIFTRLLLESVAQPTPAEKKEKRRRSAIEVVSWRCPECFEMHDDEEDAEDCCSGEEEATPAGEPIRCLVCGETAEDIEDAVDCCLWRDLGPAERFRITRAVEMGADMLDAIQAVAGAA